MKKHYVVVHESPISAERTDYGIASSLHDTFDSAENQLAYCEAMQARNHPGSEGRYYIAEVTEHD